MNNDLILDVSKRVGIVSIVIIGLMAILFSSPKAIILGYILGTLVSVVSFKLMGNTVSKAVSKEPSKATTYTSSHYMLRLGIYGLILFVAAKADYLNILSTAFGLTMIKNIIVFSTIFNKNFK